MQGLHTNLACPVGTKAAAGTVQSAVVRRGEDGAGGEDRDEGALLGRGLGCTVKAVLDCTSVCACVSYCYTRQRVLTSNLHMYYVGVRL